MLVTLRNGLVVEQLDGEFIVCDPSSAVAHRVSAEGAPWLADLLSGATVEVEPVAAVLDLVDAGVLETVPDDSSRMARRKALVVAASATSTLGLASLVLPTVAAAQTGGGGPTTTAAPPTTAPPSSTTTAPVSTDGVFVAQQSSGGLFRNRLRMIWELLDGNGDPFVPAVGVPFTYQITGPIDSTVTGSVGASGDSGSVTIPGWSKGETITVTMTSTSSPPVVYTTPFTYQEPAFIYP